MEKIKKATKRIAAVGAAAAVVASTAFGAGLGDYPSNFVKDNKFDAKVVVGSGVGADDATAANSIIEDLKAEFTGTEDKVKITYKKVEGGDSVSAIDDKSTLNYGEDLADVKADLDDGASKLLEDGSLKNDDYTQELELVNGEFSYRIFDEVDREEAEPGLFYEAKEKFISYTLDFEDEPDITTSDDRTKLIGEEMNIMGNEFTVVEIDEEELTLIGGSNKISLGEGENTKVTVGGKTYDISVQSVGENEVLLTVNGQSKSIDQYDTEELAGVSIAVTDLVDSSRDAVKGYAEIVVGGQKVELTKSGVKINDEDLDDVYEDYEVDVTFLGTATDDVFAGLTIDYKVDEDTLLTKGDYLSDILFDAFRLEYDGTNEPEYTEYKINTASDEITFSGFKLHDGNELPSEFKLVTDDVNGDEPIYLGTDKSRIFFKESQFKGTNDATATNALTLDGNLTGVAVEYTTASNSDVVFDLAATSTKVDDVFFFQYVLDDEFYLYDITSVDEDEIEADFTDLIADKETNGLDIADLEAGDLEKNNVFTDVGAGADENKTRLDLSALGTSSMLLENGLVLDFDSIEDIEFNSTSTTKLTFKYDEDEVEPDNTAYDDMTFDINFKRDADDSKDPIVLTMGTTTVGTAGTEWANKDETEDGSDFDVYVDHYGTKVTIDVDKKDDVVIEVPEEEVEAKVNIVFGDASATEMTETVLAAEKEDRVQELKDKGYTIVDTENIAAGDVEFDVTGTVLDTDAAGMSDLIVVGGPAINAVARELLGIDTYTIADAGVAAGEGVIKYYEDKNAVLVYGYSKADTLAAVNKLNAGGLSGNEEKVQ